MVDNFSLRHAFLVTMASRRSLLVLGVRCLIEEAVGHPGLGRLPSRCKKLSLVRERHLQRGKRFGMYATESAGVAAGQYSMLEERRARSRVHQAATQFCFVR